MLNGTVKYRVAKFRLRKERLTELAALAAVHGRAAAQLAAIGDAAPTAVVRAALEVHLLLQAMQSLPTCWASGCLQCVQYLAARRASRQPRLRSCGFSKLA